MPTGKGCNCWVSRESLEVQFSLRYGAHGITCPLYRESLDPVDRLHDAQERDAAYDRIYGLKRN